MHTHSYSGPLHDNDYAVALVNKNDAAMDVTLTPATLAALLRGGIADENQHDMPVHAGTKADATTTNVQAGQTSITSSGPVEVFEIFDIFEEATVGTVAAKGGSWCFELVQPHGVKFLRLHPATAATAIATATATSHACSPHPPAPPGPAVGPFPKFAPACPGPTPPGPPPPPPPPPPSPPGPPGGGRWVGPFHDTYSDQDCPNVGNHVGTLVQCETMCRALPGCNAMNWGGGGCALRQCAPGKVPTGPVIQSPPISGYLHCNTSAAATATAAATTSATTTTCPDPDPGPVPPPTPSPPPMPPVPRAPLMEKVGAYIMQAAETSPVRLRLVLYGYGYCFKYSILPCKQAKRMITQPVPITSHSTLQWCDARGSTLSTF